MHKFAILILPDKYTLASGPAEIYSASNQLLLPYKIPELRQSRYEEFKEPIWDWWILGGKWNGDINGVAVERPGCLVAFFPAMYGNKDVQLNTACVWDIPESVIPQIIIDPKGKWITDPKAKSVPTDTKDPYPPIPEPSDKWIRQIRYTFKEYANNVAVAADINFPERLPRLPAWAREKK